jgi:putative tricarboxylic transport membrane protein
MLCAGVIGYAFRKLDIPIAPLILTLILGPLMEQGLRLSLELSGGNFKVFFVRPISATILGLSILFILSTFIKGFSSIKGENSES